MSNIIVHALAIIGVLTVLLFLCKIVLLTWLTIKRNTRNDYWSLVKCQSCSAVADNNTWYLIPTIELNFTGKYLEVHIEFLKWEYYFNYHFSNEV